VGRGLPPELGLDEIEAEHEPLGGLLERDGLVRRHQPAEQLGDALFDLDDAARARHPRRACRLGLASTALQPVVDGAPLGEERVGHAEGLKDGLPLLGFGEHGAHRVEHATGPHALRLAEAEVPAPGVVLGMIGEVGAHACVEALLPAVALLRGGLIVARLLGVVRLGALLSDVGLEQGIALALEVAGEALGVEAEGGHVLLPRLVLGQPQLREGDGGLLAEDHGGYVVACRSHGDVLSPGDVERNVAPETSPNAGRRARHGGRARPRR
jgi:hypothetical protein